jgi:hypothetical protein
LGSGDVGEAGKAEFDGDRCEELSEAYESDLPAIGTVRLFMLLVEPRGDSTVGGLSSSKGISSAAGMGRPFAAATS